ncbi:DUF1549 and DUF1553 domain-containing protein [Aquisphaera insulae]|uniref:DUF1549 and DUF1553 domain-containing protein n=1 Tax=Aquisphaera insulae TaxID=2712864 RepID=UPI0013EA4393|nr:DUF1549 and DUF1553 domain-containing protein [Aquisphaera insulae]
MIRLRRWRDDQGLLRPGYLACLVLLAAAPAVAPARAADTPKSSPTRSAAADRHPGRAAFIDRLLEESWKKSGVTPARQATDEEYLRRVYLDVVGRIPSVAEARAFLTTKEPDKREKLVDSLLEHPDYPKNMGTVWTVLLIGRGNQGRTVDRGALAGWLRKQFAADRPWNEIVHDLVAATGSNKENGAVNYTLAHLEGEAVPLTSRTTRLFLGQQIQCTQCHDHPSNDWKQADFWGINAFFKGLKTEDKTAVNDTGLEAYDHTELRDQPTDAFVRYDKRNGLVGIAFPRFLDGRKISQNGDVNRRDELAKLISDPKNESLARAFVNRTWAHFHGRGFVNPVDDMGPHNLPVQPEILEKLALEFRSSGYDVKQLIRWITASRSYQVASLKPKGAEKQDSLFQVMQLRPMTPEQLFDSLLTATGAHRTGNALTGDRKRDAWLRQFTFAFGNDEGEESTNFQGTIPQALMMMNGELMNDALSGKGGSFLEGIVEEAQQVRSPGAFLVNQVYYAALSRPPGRKEADRAVRYLENNPDSLRVIQDLFWALLNSNEFILIH